MQIDLQLGEKGQQAHRSCYLGGWASVRACFLGPATRLYKKRGPKILVERYYPLLCSKQHRIDVLS